MSYGFTLGARDVHIWQASLDQAPVVVERFGQVLSDDEHVRANRFHFETDRRNFIVARGYLRMLISRYQQIPPTDIKFSYSAYGKPQLVNSTAQVPPFNFNLAHSGAVALYAFTRVGDVGVDIELIRSDFTTADIASRFFSQAECASLNDLSEELRHKAFFNCWTRKEALIKAIGTGLSLPLDQFDVSLAPGEPARLLRTRWDESDANRWTLKAIEVGADYAAAVAVAGHDWQLTCSEVDNEIHALEPLRS